MKKLYKLTKGPISVIRSDKAGVQKAIDRGFALDGEVVEDAKAPGGYRVVNPSPIFDDSEDEAAAAAEKAKKKREGLEKKAAELGIGSAEELAVKTDDELVAAIKESKKK